MDSLKKEKSKILENLKSKNWERIIEDFENVLKNDIEILKQNILENLNLLSQNGKNNYSEAYKLINEYKSWNSSDNLVLFQNYLLEKIGGKNSNINDTEDDIIIDIINGARICTYWNHSISLWDI